MRRCVAWVRNGIENRVVERLKLGMFDHRLRKGAADKFGCRDVEDRLKSRVDGRDNPLRIKAHNRIAHIVERRGIKRLLVCKTGCALRALELQGGPTFTVA